MQTLSIMDKLPGKIAVTLHLVEDDLAAAKLLAVAKQTSYAAIVREALRYGIPHVAAASKGIVSPELMKQVLDLVKGPPPAPAPRYYKAKAR